MENSNSSLFIGSQEEYRNLISCVMRVLNSSFDQGEGEVGSETDGFLTGVQDGHVLYLKMCPFIFDSWSCYNRTPAGFLQWEPCPDKPQLNFGLGKMSSKFCTEAGEWWRHPHSNRTWSNYTTCLDHEDFHFRYEDLIMR